MDDKELTEFATEFRAGILADYSGKSYRMCAMVCWPLASLLDFIGVNCTVVESDLGELNHFWILLEDGRALDPTIDQFNFLFAENWPEVYLGPLTKYHVIPASPATDASSAKKPASKARGSKARLDSKSKAVTKHEGQLRAKRPRNSQPRR